MHVAIAIVGFRNSSDIRLCLSALAGGEYKDFEVIICENGGDEAFADLCAVIPQHLPGGQVVRAVLAETNLGYGGGVNVCLRHTPDADAWWVLNPDTAPSAGALSALVARLREGDCDLVGGIMHNRAGVIENFGGRWRPWLARTEAILPGGSVLDHVDRRSIEMQMSYAHGGSMLVSRRFLELAGPMREDYFLYGEEVEWCARATQRGARLGMTAAAFVEHTKGTTTGSGGDVTSRPRLPVYMDERNKLLIVRDHYPARLPIAAAAAFFLTFVRYARRGAWRQLQYALAGWWSGLINRRGQPGWMTRSRKGT